MNARLVYVLVVGGVMLVALANAGISTSPG
jgi:hypothetical protein